LAKFLGTCQTENFVYSISENIIGGTLEEYCTLHKIELNWKQRVVIAVEITKALVNP
jgi:hypothetical protein